MTKHSVLTDYSKESDSDLDNFADAVYKALNPNTNFTWAANVITQFKARCDDYKTKLAAARKGNATDTAAKNVSKNLLIDYLRDIANEVNKQANGDIVKLVSSSLTLAKIKGKVGALPKPTGLKIVSGSNSGELLCSVDANENAIMYNFYTAPAPAPASIEEWRLIPSTTHKKNIAGFKPGTQYAIKCAFQGTSSDLAFSDTVIIFAQ